MGYPGFLCQNNSSRHGLLLNKCRLGIDAGSSAGVRATDRAERGWLHNGVVPTMVSHCSGLRDANRQQCCRCGDRALAVLAARGAGVRGQAVSEAARGGCPAVPKHRWYGESTFSHVCDNSEGSGTALPPGISRSISTIWDSAPPRKHQSRLHAFHVPNASPATC